jgi:hypothetical protein
MEAVMAGPKPMYAIRLSFENYANFASWITEQDRYKNENGNVLRDGIAKWLDDNNALVYEDCDDNSGRAFDKENDKIHTHFDKGKKFNVSLPVEICKDQDDIDIGYLKTYVQEIRNLNHTEDECAMALLGMYFLSRCR